MTALKAALSQVERAYFHIGMYEPLKMDTYNRVPVGRISVPATENLRMVADGREKVGQKVRTVIRSSNL
jgi:hypothetical protein